MIVLLAAGFAVIIYNLSPSLAVVNNNVRLAREIQA